MQKLFPETVSSTKFKSELQMLCCKRALYKSVEQITDHLGNLVNWRTLGENEGKQIINEASQRTVAMQGYQIRCQMTE